MLKTEVIEDRSKYYPPRQLRVDGVMPACHTAVEFESYQKDAKKMLRRLAHDFNPVGVKQVLAAALHMLSTREGEEWLREACRNDGRGGS